MFIYMYIYNIWSHDLSKLFIDLRHNDATSARAPRDKALRRRGVRPPCPPPHRRPWLVMELSIVDQPPSWWWRFMGFPSDIKKKKTSI